MKIIIPSDLENVFLIIFRSDPKHRDRLPIVRRHFSSVLKSLNGEGRHCDIYYSGVYIAQKKKNDSRIIMDREYKKENKDQPFVYEVRQ